MKPNTQEIKNILIAVFIVTMVTLWGVAHSPQPIVMAQEVVVSPTPSPKPLETIETPETYIRKVFGEHADKAFLLLQGNGAGSCAENRHLDPYAENRNTDWGGVGHDRGIFQINDAFHPLTDAQAFDFKQNIDYAWRMYVNDHYTFVRWTCGKVYGI
jgi:hypothetical protein